jgi:hypothetical protein
MMYFNINSFWSGVNKDIKTIMNSDIIISVILEISSIRVIGFSISKIGIFIDLFNFYVDFQWRKK